MPDSGKTAVVADDATLGTVCPPGTEPEGFVSVPRRPRIGPAATAQDLARRGVNKAIVIGPTAGEGEALASAGITAVAWLTDSHMEPVGVESFVAVVATGADAAAAQRATEWRLEPLPVGDFLFIEDDPGPAIERVFFDGPTSPERDRYLQPVKHRFDVLHLVSGAGPTELTDLIKRCQIAVDLVERPGLARRDRIGSAMASGLLVLAQAPIDRPGLMEGEHLWTFESPAELELLIADALREPGAFLQTRRNGRAFAERLRTSTVVPRVARLLD